MNLAKLSDKFAPCDIEWRIGQAGKKKNGEVWAKVLAYITNRAIMERLDAVCGPENWRNEYTPISTIGPKGERVDGFLCGISIKVGDEWVTKWDGAEMTDIETVKGGLSSSMKRAGVQWGIGRYLYDIGESWAEIHDKGAHYANCKVKVDGKEEWATFKWDHPKLDSAFLPETTPPPARTAAKTNGSAKPANGATKAGAKFQAAFDSLCKLRENNDLDGLRKWRAGVLAYLGKGDLTPAEAVTLACDHFAPRCDTLALCEQGKQWAVDLFEHVGDDHRAKLDTMVNFLNAKLATLKEPEPVGM